MEAYSEVVIRRQLDIFILRKTNSMLEIPAQIPDYSRKGIQSIAEDQVSWRLWAEG